MRAQSVVVTVTVKGQHLPRPGSDRFEQLRQAIWDGVDEVTVWIDDDSGAYDLVVTSVAPNPNRLDVVRHG